MFLDPHLEHSICLICPENRISRRVISSSITAIHSRFLSWLLSFDVIFAKATIGLVGEPGAQQIYSILTQTDLRFWQNFTKKTAVL